MPRFTSRTGTGSGAPVSIPELDDFRRDLRTLGKAWPKELVGVHRRLANKAARWAQANARAGFPIQRRAARAIRGTATASEARIGINSGGRSPAGPAFWGVKRRLGWYAAARYRDSASQNLPEWVGNSWDAAVRGQGPYAINLALAEHLPEIEREYLDELDRLARRAFPN